MKSVVALLIVLMIMKNILKANENINMKNNIQWSENNE
jgi:hypothetical protein